MPPNGRWIRAVHDPSGVILAEQAKVAASPWSRMRGLLGRTPLRHREGLLIVPCKGVHTLGMTFPIDVLHLDRQGVVRAVVHNLDPWRLGPLVWQSYQALELPAGAAALVRVGDRVTLARL